MIGKGVPTLNNRELRVSKREKGNSGVEDQTEDD